jgi:DNA-binding beta-propeller fold protein YncE
MLQHLVDIDLPPHVKPGGFDHAAVHGTRGRVYVAHTANDAVDVIDGVAQRYLWSIPALPGVAGALIAEERDLVFTSNRGDNTVGMFSTDDAVTVARVPVGIRPNGLAYDAGRNLLLAANVGDPEVPGSFTVSVVDVGTRHLVADIPVAGRTRWTVFDAVSQAFYVNVLSPPQIEVVDVAARKVVRSLPMPAHGPHGLEVDSARRRLFCACDANALVEVGIDSGEVLRTAELAGAPDVIFFNARLRHLYVAIGEPGVIEVFDTERLRRLQTVPTERGAHTIAFDAARDTVYAFLPTRHQAAVFLDGA